MVDQRGAVSLAPVNVRERGYASDAVGFWDDLAREEVPELRWPLSVGVFNRMRRADSQVKSVLRAVRAPIVRTQWTLDGTHCDPDVTRFVAANLGLPVKDADPDENYATQLRGRDRFSWSEHLRLALLMLPFGHSYFEQVYRFDADGMLRIRKLGVRLPHTISKINVAADGGLVSIEQRGITSTAGTVTLPVSRLVAYVLDREGGNWLGESLLRSAYKNWLLKDRALRTWSSTIDRQGMGLPIYTAAPNEASLEAGQKIATQARSGSNAGAALPNGANLALLGVQGTLPDIEKFVAYNDQQIARSALGHFLNLGGQTGGQVGSYNLGSVLADTFNLAVGEVADLIAETASAHIIEDLVDINFGADVPAPVLTFADIGVRRSELDDAREAAGLTSDAELVRFLRTLNSQEDA